MVHGCVQGWLHASRPHFREPMQDARAKDSSTGSAIRVAVLACVAALGLARSALAAELRVEAEAECPSADSLEAQLEQSLQRPLAEIEAGAFEVEVSARSAGGYRLKLRALSGQGGSQVRVRELIGDSCQEVFDAAAVAIAMAITAGAPTPAPEATSTKPRAQPARAQPARAQPARADDSPGVPPASAPGGRDLESAWHAEIALGPAIELGVLPGLGPGAQLELGVGLDWLGLRLGASVFARQRAESAAGDAAGDFGLILGGALLCAERGLRAWRALACAGGELGSLSAEGDLDVALSERTVHAALRADAGVRWLLEPGLSLLARAGVGVVLTRQRFQANRGSITLHRPAAVAGRALLAAELALF